MSLAAEHELMALVVLGIVVVALYRVVLWLMEAERTADPWGEEIDKALEQDDAVPVCHHCLTPQRHNGWFCPECGATVGPYCNYLPFVYLFSQGEVVRAGVTERFRRSPLIVVGLVLFPLAMSLSAFSGFIGLVLTLAYWFVLMEHMRHRDTAGTDAAPSDGQVSNPQ